MYLQFRYKCAEMLKHFILRKKRLFSSLSPPKESTSSRETSTSWTLYGSLLIVSASRVEELRAKVRKRLNFHHDPCVLFEFLKIGWITFSKEKKDLKIAGLP